MAALCTFVVVTCSAVSDVWIWLSGAHLAGLLRQEFLVPAHLLVNYISSPHRKFCSSSGFSSATLRRLHASSFLLVCWTDSIAGLLWCTVTDVLFAQILSTCASSPSCANWSYYVMYYEDAIPFRITLRTRCNFVVLRYADCMNFA